MKDALYRPEDENRADKGPRIWYASEMKKKKKNI